MKNPINPIKSQVDDLKFRPELIKLISNATTNVEFRIHDIAKNMGIEEYREVDNIDSSTKKNQIFQAIMAKVLEDFASICSTDIY
jgi:hypothetical protein